MVAALNLTPLRDGLHIVQDVINHFYRRWEPFPWFFWEFFPTKATEFEIQQLIEARFREVFTRVFEFGDVTHLTIISHSQGTMIAVNVLSLFGLDQATRNKISGRLQDLHEFHLITMGSPLSHLYQYYFPGRYPSFTSSLWNDLRDQLQDCNWVNIYRIDDYVGTHIHQVGPERPNWPGLNRPLNVPITSGGHTKYWAKDVFDRPEMKEALPGL